MKNLVLIISLFIALSLKAQNFCEVYIPKTNNLEMGYKVIETQDGNYLTLSLFGAGGAPQYPGNPLPTLTKLSKCGDTLWRKKFDWYSSDIAGLWEEKDGSIEFATYTGYPDHLNEGNIKLYKTTSNGDLIRKSVIADTTKIYGGIKCLKVGTNRYFFTGFYFVRSSKSYTSSTYLITDSLGNIIKRDSLDHAGFSNIAKKTDSTLLFIGKNKDTAFVILNMDTNGNVLSNNSFKLPVTTGNLSANYDCNELVSFRIEGNLFKIIKIDFLGNIKKEYSVLIPPSYPISLIPNEGLTIQLLPDDKILLSGNTIMIIDSNLKVTSYYYDSLSTDYFKINHTIFTKDSFMVSVGTGGIWRGGTGMRSSSYWFSKKSIHQLVQLLTLSGPSLINTNKGSVQITSSIAPTGANNKNILWSINDTNLATITQTGLLTAKANGTAIVTATAADGGGAKATKAITISNQNVGINEVNLNNQITVYPNPASNVLTINQINANFSYKIINLQGQEILNGELKKPFSSIDISKLEAGSYIVGLTTETGIYWKKFIKN